MSHSSLHAQRGATALVVALWMTVALSCLMVIDVGNIFWQKRELQKIADLAALAGASGTVQDSCRPVSGSAAQENAVVNGLNESLGDALKAQAGSWNPEGSVLSAFFQEGGMLMNACHVEVERHVPYLFMFDAKNASSRTLTAQATAVQNSPVAKIGIRSTLASLDTEKSALLNLLVGGLLGGNLNLDAVGWKAIAGLDLNLLKYLRALTLETDLTVGDYEDLLKTDLELGVLLDAMVNVLEQQESTANIGLQALRSIQAMAHVSGLRLQLAQLLGIQTGTPSSALDTSLNVLELVQALVQVGNSNHAAQAGVSIPLPGLTGIDLALSVIEPPQLFAMGNPVKAANHPNGPLHGDDRIYIRTAQLRLLLSVDMKNALGSFSSGLIDVLDGLLNGLLKVLSPVLNLVNFLSGGVNIFNPSIQYLVPELLLKSLRLDVGIDVGGGDAYVTGHACTVGNRTVKTNVRSSLAHVRLGQWGSTTPEAQANAFSNGYTNPMGPMNLLRLDCSGCDGKGVTTKQYFGGLGVNLDTRVGGAHGKDLSDTVERNLPAVSFDEPLQWTESAHTENILGGLGSSVKSLNPLVVLPANSEASKAGINGILSALDSVLSDLLTVVSSLLSKVLSPILDPLLNWLLGLLGLQLGTVDVAAQLKCGGGAELVY